ncbi:RICIN domain-containing protein [Streptomyces sp. NPDC021749]|uniref:RICIN domain-containing protein n=1 Tax=Streptomyces sp. NPDC021749 TaxID=3154905 RepID=UPI0033C80DAD
MGQGPDPAAAESPAQFMELMRQLRRWADLSYRQLERNATDAGNVLPRATISAALSREELPRAARLAAYVQACGGDDDTVAAWLDARRRLSLSDTASPGSAGENAARTAAREDDDAPQKTVPVPAEAAAQEHHPATDPPGDSCGNPASGGPVSGGPSGDPTSGDPSGDPAFGGPSGDPASGDPASGDPASGDPSDDTTDPANAPSNWRRQGPLVAIAACTVVGIVALALLPSGDGSDDRAGGAPTSTPHGKASPSTRAKESSSAPTEHRTADARPSASPTVSPAGQDKTADPRPSHTPTRGPAGMPAAGWTRIHPASSPSLCLTEGRERNGRTDREIAVQHSCADAPVPRVYLEKLSGQTYRIQWHNPDPGKGIGCLAVDGASTTPGALLAPRDCEGGNSQKFRLEASGSGFRLRPLHSGLCVGFLPPATDGAEAVQANCTGAASQAFAFTTS